MPQSQPTKSLETVARLKELLFDSEAQKIDSLSKRIEELQKRAGSDELFRTAVAKALPVALETVEKGPHHRDATEAMAPMVLATLRQEMRQPQMQDQIAGIMHRRLGEMVRQYIASAMRDLMDKINARLESGLGRSKLMLWLNSLASGQSMAEQALAETQRLEVVEVYLVRRGSGEVIHHWERAVPGEPLSAAKGDNRDTLVGGFLAAITALAEEAFEARKESLRTIDTEDHRIYIRGSPDHLLAVKCEGTAPDAVEQLLDQELLRVLGEHQRIEQQAAASPEADPHALARGHEALLQDTAQRLEDTIGERLRALARGRLLRLLKLLAALIGLPLLALAAWHYYVGWVTSEMQARADRTLAEIPSLKGYPVKAHVERGAGRIWVTGLAPDEATLRLVLERLRQAAPDATLSETISVLPQPDVDARLGAAAEARAVGHARRRLEAAAAELAAAQGRSADAEERDVLAEVESVAVAAIRGLDRTADADRQGLAEVVGGAVEGLRQAAGRLGTLAGIDVKWPGPVPGVTVERAEALSLAADRVSVLTALVEQRRSVTPIARQVESVRDGLAGRLADLERRLEHLRPRPPTPREQLAAFVRGNAIFFGNDAEYRDAAAAARTLDQLAPLITADGTLVRVIGYTDEAGTAARNSPLAQARADKVAADLEARGVGRHLLSPVGRANGVNLAPGTGIDSPNRRVEFELAFEGERGGRP